MQLLAATVSKAPRQVKTKFGDRLVCDVTLPDGTETAIWGPVTYSPLGDLEYGDAVTVSRDSKGKIHIIENHLTHPDMIAPAIQAKQEITQAFKQKPAQNSLTSEGMSADTKRAIAAYVGEMGDLYAFCFNTVYDKLPDASEETQRAAASSLFIAAQRRFNLA